MSIATKIRSATSGETAAFHARLEAILDTTKTRLAKLASSAYELRVMTIRSHDVRAHTRGTYQKVYLAKKANKQRGKPIALAVAGVTLVSSQPPKTTRVTRRSL